MQKISNMKMYQLFLNRTQYQYAIVTIIAIFLIQLFYTIECGIYFDWYSGQYDEDQTKNIYYYQFVGCIILTIIYFLLLLYALMITYFKNTMNPFIPIALILICLVIGHIITFIGWRGSFQLQILYYPSRIFNNILLFMMTLPLLYFGLSNFQENDDYYLSFKEQQFTSLFGAFLIQLIDALNWYEQTVAKSWMLNLGYFILAICNYLQYPFTKWIAILTKLMMSVGIILCFIQIANNIQFEARFHFLYVSLGLVPFFLYFVALFSSTIKNQIAIPKISNSQIEFENNQINSLTDPIQRKK